MAGKLGAFFAVLGGGIALVQMAFVAEVNEWFFGGMGIVACGLLLRIEQAIRDAPGKPE